MSETEDKVLLEFPVLWEGWDCDSKAWVMERADGTRYLRMTNHGSPYESSPKALNSRIDEYERVLRLTRNATQLLKHNAND